MAQASASIDIPASPSEVWQLIGGFNSLPDWLGYIPKSELSEGGRVRHLANPKGDQLLVRGLSGGELFATPARFANASQIKIIFYEIRLCEQRPLAL
jgi:hypothetical protein